MKLSWDKEARNLLVGKSIIDVRYLEDNEKEDMGWDERGLCFFLSDGTQLIISRDDEGNGPGSVFYSTEQNKNGTFPTLNF